MTPIKQYTDFTCLLHLSAKYCFKQFYNFYSILHYPSIKPPRKAQNAYTICWYRCTADPLRSALRLELTKGTRNQRRTHFACSIVSRDMCLQLTKLQENLLKNEYFIDNSLVFIVLQTVLYAFLFFFFFFFFFVGYILYGD